MYAVEIKACTFDDETGVLEIELSDGKRSTVAVSDIERDIPMSIIMESKYIWLLENEPSTLADLHLSGKLEEFLIWYEKSQNEQETDLRRCLEQRHSPAEARALAREFMMYDS